eukprot:1749567-Prymnesium_polylepis.1
MTNRGCSRAASTAATMPPSRWAAGATRMRCAASLTSRSPCSAVRRHAALAWPTRPLLVSERHSSPAASVPARPSEWHSPACMRANPALCSRGARSDTLLQCDLAALPGGGAAAAARLAVAADGVPAAAARPPQPMGGARHAAAQAAARHRCGAAWPHRAVRRPWPASTPARPERNNL